MIWNCCNLVPSAGNSDFEGLGAVRVHVEFINGGENAGISIIFDIFVYYIYSLCMKF